MQQTYSGRPSLAAWNALGGFKLVKEAVLEEDDTSWSIDFTDFDWSKYAVVCISIELIGSSTADARVLFNGGEIGNYTLPTVRSDTLHKPIRAWLAPMHDAYSPFKYKTEGLNKDVDITANVGISIFQSIVFYGNGASLKAGSVVRFFAIP